MHYLKAAKVTRQLPQTSFIPEKDPGKETQQFQKMKETRETTLLRNVFRKDEEFALTGKELCDLFEKLFIVCNYVLKHSIWVSL